jgi:hypothetical protein
VIRCHNTSIESIDEFEIQFPSLQPANYSLDTGELDLVVFGLNTYNQATTAFAYFRAEADFHPSSGTSTRFISSLISKKKKIFTTPVSDLEAAALLWVARAFCVFEYEDLDGNKGFQPLTVRIFLPSTISPLFWVLALTRYQEDKITGWYNLSADINVRVIALPLHSIEFSFAHARSQWQVNVVQEEHEINGEKMNIYVVYVSTPDEVFNARISASGAPVEINGQVRSSLLLLPLPRTVPLWPPAEGHLLAPHQDRPFDQVLRQSQVHRRDPGRRYWPVQQPERSGWTTVGRSGCCCCCRHQPVLVER